MKRTRKGSLTNLPESAAVGTPETVRSKTSNRDIVTMTVRFSREAWQEIHDMARSDNVSVNTFILNAVNRDRQARGLPPLKPVPTATRQ